MRFYYLILYISALIFNSCGNKQINHSATISENDQNGFDTNKDLLLAHYDSKTDVDDLHSVAAFATLLIADEFDLLNYHAVAGAYGIQEGLYVPANELFELAFEENWPDAHADFEGAVQKVKTIALETLNNTGDLWIAEAGQSDFSAELVRAIKASSPDTNIKNRIHIVQHSEWNESVTDSVDLAFVQKNIDYHKIPDGNALNNGTPGFREPNFSALDQSYSSPQLLRIWTLAIDIANNFNGVEGRYLNTAIKAGGMDFSDFSEICWILKIPDVDNVENYFQQYSR